jgi:hypothetical protein
VPSRNPQTRALGYGTEGLCPLRVGGSRPMSASHGCRVDACLASGTPDARERAGRASGRGRERPLIPSVRGALGEMAAGAGGRSIAEWYGKTAFALLQGPGLLSGHLAAGLRFRRHRSLGPGQRVGDVRPQLLPLLAFARGQPGQSLRLAHAGEVGVCQPVVQVAGDKRAGLRPRGSGTTPGARPDERPRRPPTAPPGPRTGGCP